MSKQKIIKTDDLKLLKVQIINEIDEAEIQANLYAEETEKQKSTKHDQVIIDETLNSRRCWLDRRLTLHECLVKIERYSSEIEI